MRNNHQTQTVYAQNYLKETVDTVPVIPTLLYHIFRMSVEVGVVPTAWKIASILPIYKKGGKQKVGKYRPVSFTSIRCNLFVNETRRWSYERRIMRDTAIAV